MNEILEPMKKKTRKKKKVETEPVRIDKEAVEAVRQEKDTTGIPIGTFFRIAAEEKLEKIRNSSN